MKIGTSLGKCVRSLLDGEVAYDDVLFIVSNTMGPDEEKLRGIMQDYYYTAGGGRDREYDLTHHTVEEAEEMAVRLFKEGKLFQPRIHIKGWGNAHGLKDTWYDIVPSMNFSGDAAKNAWDAYVMMSKLSQ